MLHITYGDVTRQFNAKQLLVPEARLLKSRTGLNPPDFFQGISEFDPECVFTLWLLACMRAGEPVADPDALAAEFDLLALKLEDDEEPEEDPTGPGPSTGATSTG